MPVARFIIRGRVQGVGYRAWATDEARRRGLAGWVRNRRDGSVEVVASGDQATLDDFAAVCRTGPALARVTEVAVSQTDAGEVAGPGFEPRPTV